MKRSISGRANCKAPGMEDRGPMLREIEEVYGPGLAAVAQRYIDAPDPHPHEQYQQEARGQSGSGVSDGSLPEGMGYWVRSRP